MWVEKLSRLDWAAMILNIFMWSIGGGIGFVHWMEKEEFLHAAFSLLIPLYGAITLLWQYYPNPV